MKKGLLSLLAVTLTIVSCQNYDDQFAELTGLVSTLSKEVTDLSTVKGDLTALTSLVNGLDTAITAIPDPTTSISNVASGLASATSQINLIKAILDSGLATASDIASITSTIAEITAGINTLLTKNATLVIDLIINDTTTLEAAKELVLTGATSPKKYILTGNVNVDHSKLTFAQIIEANTMTAKIISVSGSVTTSGTVDLTGLSAILTDYTINGSTRPQDTAITSIGNDLTVSGKLGALDFKTLVSVVGDVTVSDPASATIIDFRNVVGTAGNIQTGATAGVNVYANATEVHTGSLTASSVTAAKASAVALGQTTNVGGLTVTAPQASVVNINGLVAGAGALSINATKTAIVHVDSMTSVLQLDVTGNIVAELHIKKLAIAPAAGNVLWAETVDASLLADISGATSFKGTTALTAPVLDAITGAFALTFTALEPVNLPLLALGAGSMVTTATTVTIKDSGDADLTKFLTAENTIITLTGQKRDTTVGTGFQTVTSFTMTSGGANTSAATDYDFTAAAANMIALTSLTLNGVANATIGTASTPNTSLVTLATSGEMISLDLNDLDKLATFTAGHIPMTYASLPAAARQTVNIQNCLLLKSVDLTSVVQLMVANISTNAILASITAPAVGTPLKYNGVMNITVSSNAVSATHTQAVSGGALEDIVEPSLRSWRDYIIQHVTVQQAKITDGTLAANTLVGYDALSDGTADGTAVGTFSIDYDKYSAASSRAAAGTGGAATAFAVAPTATGVVGTITTVQELALIDNNVLNP
ncbi:MAG: beta strand repeat-containing protein [Methylophagaceae bacterium]